MKFGEIWRLSREIIHTKVSGYQKQFGGRDIAEVVTPLAFSIFQLHLIRICRYLQLIADISN